MGGLEGDCAPTYAATVLECRELWRALRVRTCEAPHSTDAQQPLAQSNARQILRDPLGAVKCPWGASNSYKTRSVM
eukprot:2840208-Amphidinium_carterae.1